VPFTLAGERIVLFRDAGGAAAALIDRCPHRGVALSLGRRTPEGCVACPFHGWQFDAAGRNVHVPFNPNAKRETLGATALPVREIGGLIWAHTGTDVSSEPNVPDALLRDDVRITTLERDWNAHWTRAMENMLDYAHLPFVHRTTIGRDIAKKMTPETTLDMGWHDAPHGARITVRVGDDAPRDILEWHAPNGMALLLAPPPKLFRIHAFCVPTERNRTRMLVVMARAFAKSALFNPFFDLTNVKILGQDRAVVESSSPAEVPPPSEEVSVATDRPTLAFRRHYAKHLKGSHAVRALRRAS
jgi:phenylpropionate dioxygenase-like ring-hydroxylating dioxygenase large terminal subunit